MIRSASAFITTPDRRQTITMPAVLDQPVLHSGTDDGRFGIDQRHGLALHVGAHQGAVGVIVLQKGDQRRRDGDDLLGARCP